MLTLSIQCDINITEYTWNEEKNQTLKKARNIGFENVIEAVKNGNQLEIGPNTGKYQHLQVLFVLINGYVFKVPFVIDLYNRLFLKTIIPSRKATKKWLSVLKKPK